MRYLIILTIFFSLSSFAIEAPEIDRKLSKVDFFQAELLQISKTPVNQRVDSGKFYYSSPSVKIELMGQNILMKEDLIYVYNDNSYDGMIAPANEMIYFRENPLATLSKNYDIEIVESKAEWQITANAKSDMNVMKYVIHIDKEKLVPIYIEKHDITGNVTIFQLESISFQNPDANVFVVPEDVDFGNY